MAFLFLASNNMEHRHFKIFKPYGMLSQFINNKRRKKALLSELYNFPEGTMAIGRLDVQSEGLLLLTTDGKVSEMVRQKNIEKEYWAQVEGSPSHTAIKSLSNGVDISVNKSVYRTKACQIESMDEPDLLPRGRKIRDSRHGPTSWLKIIITEGKNRQVRKMTAAVGHPTLRLVRVRIGNIILQDLEPGDVSKIDSEVFEHFDNGL